MTHTFLWTGAATLVLSAAQALAATFYIAPNGADTASRNGSWNRPWRTIDYAINRMSASDELVLKNGTYRCSTTQYIDRGGTASQPLVVRALNPRQATIDFAGVSGEYVNGVEIRSPHVEFKEINVANNLEGGRGIFVVASDVTVEGCEVWGHGGPGINVGEGLFDYPDAPDNVVVQGCTLWDNCRWNDPSSGVYMGFREQNGGWPAALSITVGRSVKLYGNHVFENHGEGIIFTRVRGGNAEMVGNLSHDNYSVNLYIDAAQGEPDNYMWIAENTCTSFNVSRFYRNGGPAQNLVLSSEDYDFYPFITGNQRTRYAAVVGNEVSSGLRGLAVVNYGGPGIDSVWIDETVATGNGENFYQEPSPKITNIWLGSQNSGF